MSVRAWRPFQLALLIVAVLAAIGVWAFRPQPVSADFAAVDRGPLEVTVEEEGRTRVRDRYVVSAPLPGRMRRIELELAVGDPSAGLQIAQDLVARYPNDPEAARLLESARYRWRLSMLPRSVQDVAAKPDLDRADFAATLEERRTQAELRALLAACGAGDDSDQSSDSAKRPPRACGNGVINEGEQCDGRTAGPGMEGRGAAS